jgi:heterotetrameric sarcosine oxidase alpha subunit/heterotetrameric sarcosine oxidase gamma subunit
MSAHRLDGEGAIRRDQPVSFTFDGKSYSGYAGDTLASALLASGVKRVGRSFKYHRPRGVLTAGSEEPNALVELRTGPRREPNTRATVIELFDGLEARSQNRWPSLTCDFGAVSSLFSRVLVAGFYYKTFMWPAAFWERVYEPLIRRAAGLGRASLEKDPDGYEKAHAFCDVLVIGAGPAGLAAALSAGRSGARVILADEDFLAGGRLNSDTREIDGISGAIWARNVLAELLSLPEVRVMTRTTVFGAYDGNTFGALERVADHLCIPAPHQPRQRMWKIVARHTILASGATERPIVFGDNDRPGVMLASAVRTYVKRFRVAPGRQVALFTASDDGWKTVAELVQAGVDVAAVVDARTEVVSGVMSVARSHDVRVMLGAQVIGTTGVPLGAIVVRDKQGRVTRIPADTLAIGGGWNPNTALTTHTGGKPRWSDTISAYVPGELPRSIRVVGAAAGDFSLSGALRAGASAGEEAALAAGFHVGRGNGSVADDEFVDSRPMWSVPDYRGKAFVDFQNDVTAEDVALAEREGYRSADLLKRYTTLGMATDQGKTSNLAGHAIMASLTGRAVADLGTITSRPPYTPVAIGALAGMHRGRHFKPFRYTAGHQWARELDAEFVEAGQWLRAQWFPAPGETDWRATVAREVAGVRNAVGVCDVSTLGKIDVQGADAATFLDRIYSNMFSTLPVGKVRYGLMLREDGIVMDDGTTAHIESGHYIVSTTTANAAKVMQHLEHARQVLWPELDVQLASITEQWAQYAIAGPRSRELLEKLLGDALDVSDAAFPYLACAEFVWKDHPARLFRISFSGEMGYELAVPAGRGDAAVRAIMAAGESLGVVPYGTEALGVMRIEKGHAAGNELNGTTTAADLGLGKLMSKKKDFIGNVLVNRPGLSAPGRPALVGVKPIDRSKRLHAGAHFLNVGAPATLENDQGFISSVAFSPTLGHWIALGFLVNGASRHGERVRAHDPLHHADVDVEVTHPVSFDPEGNRLLGGGTAVIGQDRTRGTALPALATNSTGGSLRATCAAARSTRNIELNATAAAGLHVTIHANATAAAGLHVTIHANAAAAAGLHVTIHGNLGIARLSARKGARPGLVQRFRADFGLDLPSGPRRTTSPHWAAIGLAPDSWLLTCEGSPYSLAPSLESSLGPAASITDQTDAYVVLTLTGAKLREILAKLIPIDLHPRSFQPGDAAQTLAAHISIILWRLEDLGGVAVFELAVPRSYFASLRESLYAAAAEFCNARAPITQHAAVNRTSEPLT